MTDKNWLVTYKLPETRGGKTWQEARVTAKNFGMASHSAWKEISKRDGIKGKRLTEATVSIVQIKEN